MTRNEILKGYKPLKPGKIHLFCPKCGRKQSNMNRDETDPPGTILIELLCPKCADGDFSEPIYFDKDGNQIMEELQND